LVQESNPPAFSNPCRGVSPTNKVRIDRFRKNGRIWFERRQNIDRPLLIKKIG